MKNYLFYDSDCGLCDHFVQFLLQFEPAETIGLAGLRSDKALQVLESSPNMATVIFVKDGSIYRYSDAAIEIFKLIPNLRFTAVLIKLIPKTFRDRVYMFISKNRHLIPGKSQCILPPGSDSNWKFVDNLNTK